MSFNLTKNAALITLIALSGAQFPYAAEAESSATQMVPITQEQATVSLIGTIITSMPASSYGYIITTLKTSSPGQNFITYLKGVSNPSNAVKVMLKDPDQVTAIITLLNNPQAASSLISQIEKLIEAKVQGLGDSALSTAKGVGNSALSNIKGVGNSALSNMKGVGNDAKSFGQGAEQGIKGVGRDFTHAFKL